MDIPIKGPPFTPVLCSLKRKRPPQIEIPNVLQEIQTGHLKFREPVSQDQTYSSSGIGVGVFAVKGKKKFMEDTHKIISCLHGNSSKGFFGVYDGHGGKKAAEFVAENLHTNILKTMENCEGNVSKEEAVKNGYLKTDEEFLRQVLTGAATMDGQKEVEIVESEGVVRIDAPALGLVSGSCCVTALIEGQEVVISNLGDCRAVLCRGGVAEALTKDHRAEDEDERNRILNKGGFVEIHRGAWRVHGVLCVSRSIGDAHLKQWVSAEPETKILQLTPDMEFLVLASDGLWEEVGNQEAVDIVVSFCKKPDKKLRPGADINKDDDLDYGLVNISPSGKLRRISLVKRQKGPRQSPHPKKIVDRDNAIEFDFPSENESPPSKLRKISLVKRINVFTECPVEQNSGHKKQPATSGLVAACKELANLAVSRGSLDDITVMIIDLNHFKCIS